MRKTNIWLAAAMLGLAGPAAAEPITQFTYSVSCATNPAYALWGDCSTLDHLYQRAREWTRTANPQAGSTPETPSIVLVSSTTIPISAIFRFHIPPPVITSRGTRMPQLPVVSYFQPARTGLFETDMKALADLDRQVTATRALKIHPVKMPDSLGRANSTSYPGIIRELNDTFDRQGTSVDVLWGLAGFGFQRTNYLEVIDQRTGEQHRIYRGDTLTVEFADGSTIEVKYDRPDPNSSLTFIVQPASARKPDGQPYMVIAKPAKPGNAPVWVPPNQNASGRLIGPSNSCTFPAGQVCTSDGGMVRCRNSRAYVGPC